VPQLRIIVGMLPDDIKNYANQFEYEPIVENLKKLKKFSKFLVCGMGGSHLGADIIKAWHPELDLLVWHNYGLPKLHEKDIKDRLVILSSYSGGTEETIDALQAAKSKKLNIAVVAARGKLIKLAQNLKIPYVQMPDFHMQPRMATGLSVKALLALMGERAWLAEAKTLMTLSASLARGTPRPRSREATARRGARRVCFGPQYGDRAKLEN
jgi:glucose-6-phosphate isomerase